MYAGKQLAHRGWRLLKFLCIASLMNLGYLLYFFLFMLFLVLHYSLDVLRLFVGFWQNNAVVFQSVVSDGQLDLVHAFRVPQYILGNIQLTLVLLRLQLTPVILIEVIGSQFLVRRVLLHVHHEDFPGLVVDVRVKVVLFHAEALGRHGRDH